MNELLTVLLIIYCGAFPVYRLSILITQEEPVQFLRNLFGVTKQVTTAEIVTAVNVNTMNDNGEIIEVETVRNNESVSLNNRQIVIESIKTMAIVKDAPSSVQPTFFARGITCPYCVSFWVSMIASAALWSSVGNPLSWIGFFVAWLGIAGFVSTLLSITD